MTAAKALIVLLTSYQLPATSYQLRSILWERGTGSRRWWRAGRFPAAFAAPATTPATPAQTPPLPWTVASVGRRRGLSLLRLWSLRQFGARLPRLARFTLLLALRRSGRVALFVAGTAAATSSAARRRLLAWGLGRLLWLRILLSGLAALLGRLWPLRLLRSLLLAALLPFRTWRPLGWRRPTILAFGFAGALLELLDLPAHETARLRVVLQADLVMSAVGTPPPTFGVGLLAIRAENALRQRQSARIVHFRRAAEE